MFKNNKFSKIDKTIRTTLHLFNDKHSYEFIGEEILKINLVWDGKKTSKIYQEQRAYLYNIISGWC